MLHSAYVTFKGVEGWRGLLNILFALGLIQMSHRLSFRGTETKQDAEHADDKSSAIIYSLRVVFTQLLE